MTANSTDVPTAVGQPSVTAEHRKPEVLAAIDLGTNSVHLVVAKVNGSHIEVIEREREMVRLGSSAGDMKRIVPAAIERAVEALDRFRQLAAIHDARVRVVATSAVREASNRHVLLERARTEAGVDVENISGFEEARLIHLGVLQAVPVFDRQRLLCDIGGGSTELIVGRHAEVLASRSLRLGAIRLMHRFFPGSVLQASAVDACRQYIRTTLAAGVRELRRLGYEVAVGSSGTIGAVCSMVLAQRGHTRSQTLNNLTISAAEIDEVVARLTEVQTVEARRRIPGLDPRRADIIVPGALILEQVVAMFAIEELTFSDYALREGVLLDTWQRRHGGSLHHLSDLRRRSVLQLAQLMDEDPRHSSHVARLALQLFDETRPLHGLDDDSREVLEAGALLCNIGLYVSHAAHHKHSYYLIRHSEHLTGFTDHEIELIAQVARYHRKSLPRPKHEAFAALSLPDQRRVRVLAGLLRVAVGLDRNHAGRVEAVRCRPWSDRRLTIEVVPKAGQDVSLELHAAAQRRELMQKALDMRVDVVLA
jgi:exopolyphosphatase / guanosine-5'-triphosphate,3'-diphosphate pyrophosphatase